MSDSDAPQMVDLELKDPSLLGASSFVNGEFCRCASRGDVVVINPANGRVVRRVLAVAPSDLDKAVSSADHAFHNHWRDTSPSDRADLLREWAKHIREAANDIAHIITLENGKPLKESQGEVAYGVSFIDWYAAEALRCHGSGAYDVNSETMAVMSREPVGVVLAVTPWNFPCAMITRKVAAAIAAGCTCISKPSDQTPLTCLALAELARRAGIPPGVFNVVVCKQEHSRQVVESLLRSGPVRMVTFTGSTRVGSSISQVAAEGMLHTAMELGGNAPFVIFDDADIDAAVSDLMASKFRGAGQVCIASDRIYVQDVIYDSVIEALRPKIMELGEHVGDGLYPGIKMGPLINHGAVRQAMRLVQDAVAQGARVEVGGKRLGIRKYDNDDRSEEDQGRAVELVDYDPVNGDTETANIRNSLERNSTKSANIPGEGHEYTAQVILNTKNSGSSFGKGSINGNTSKWDMDMDAMKGWFFAPTLLSNVQDDMMVHDCEIFGPIVALYRFSDEEEVISRIRGQHNADGRKSCNERRNDLGYSGLAAYVYTRDLGRAQRAAKNIPAGMVGINCVALSNPSTAFGGVGRSGHGREGGEGLDEYTQCKLRMIRSPQPK